MTAKQISRLAASLVKHQASFAPLPFDKAQWIMKHTAAAIALFVMMIQNRAKAESYIKRQLAKRKGLPQYRGVPAKTWYLVREQENVPQSRFRVRRLEPVFFMHPDKPRLSGAQVRSRAIRHGANFGLLDAIRILENSEQIPEKLRNWHLVFPGTILRYRGYDPHVACLYWSYRQWHMYFCHFDGWGGEHDSRFVFVRERRPGRPRSKKP